MTATPPDPRKTLANERKRLRRERSYANLVNTAVAARHCGQIESATSLLREALKLDQVRPEVWADLGQCATDLGQFDQAPFYFQRALQCIEKSGTPVSAAHNTLLAFAYSMMRLGRFEYIWPIWETARIGNSWHPFPGVPIWDGAPTENLLVVPEGGYGDGFCFLRWLPFVKARRVTLLLWPALADFAREVLQNLVERVAGPPMPPGQLKSILGGNPPTSGPFSVTVLPLSHEFRHGELAQFSACTSILSLPAHCGMSDWSKIPPPLNWRPRAYFDLGQPEDRIGFCWRAEENGTARPVRSLSNPAADAIGRKLASKGAEVVSLCPRGANLAKPDAENPAEFLPAGVRQNGDAMADWESTARTILHCKLVVTVDTAVAHLAGSLGVPTICLLPRRSDWKWSAPGGPESNWYGPNFGLFRNPNPVTWDVDSIKNALEAVV